MKKEERKITIELLEAESMNTYKILAEFFARKFNEKGGLTKWNKNDLINWNINEETVVQQTPIVKKRKS